MKTRTVVLCGLILVVVLFINYGFSFAESSAGTSDSKVGKVNVRDILRDCEANVSYRKKMDVERTAEDAELGALVKKIAADEAGLEALKPSSSDYMTQYEALINDQVRLEAASRFIAQKRAFQDAKWAEKLFKEVIRITKELAEKKDLTMVVVVEEPEFPMRSAQEIMMSLQTHKVIYSDGCVDLSAEVIAEMDKIAATLKP